MVSYTWLFLNVGGYYIIDRKEKGLFYSMYIITGFLGSIVQLGFRLSSLL